MRIRIILFIHLAPNNSPQQLQGITISKSILEINWNVSAITLLIQLFTNCIISQKPELAFSDGDTQIVGYRLWWTSKEDNYKFALVDGSVTRFTLLDLIADTIYSLKVQAKTGGGYGPNSTLIEAMTYPGS